MITELDGKVAVVTGAGSGIGRALAQRCAAEGMRVVAADVEPGALDETIALVGSDAVGVVTDVSDEDAVTALADRAFDSFGCVHLLCNNAGVFQAGLLWERTRADWDWVLGVNLWGIIHAIRAFLPRMTAGGEEGHVVNTASLAGIASNAYSGPYTVSKFAAVALTESLAHDLAATDTPIGTSVLVPGAVDTRIAVSNRNRPGALADGAGADDSAFMDSMLADVTKSGADPAHVAGLVVDAVRTGQFVIPTTAGYDDQVRHRAAALLDRTAPRALPFD